jgi:hypothetical protein
MNKTLLEDTSTEEFERIMENFITREQTEIATSDFFKALALIDQEKQKHARKIKLRTHIINGKISFSEPEPEETIMVEGNEIVLEDGRRILLELVAEQPPFMTSQ